MLKKIISLIIFLVAIPSVIIVGYFSTGSKRYLIVSVLIIILAMFPFFISLEKKKISARELVTIASLIAISVAGRAAFFGLQQVKPVCALAIIAAISFGPNVGFIVGSLTMLLSNFIFGQGIHTPFQMFGMGMVALFCGLMFYHKKIGENRFIVSIVGGFACFIIYGLIVDLSSVLLMSSDYSLSSIVSIYLSGVPFNAIHAVSTFVILILAEPAMCEKLKRIQIKYDLFGGVEK